VNISKQTVTLNYSTDTIMHLPEQEEKCQFKRF